MRFLFILALQVLSTYGYNYMEVPGERCDRTCDGTRYVCVFYLTVDHFVTAGPNCGNCLRGTYADCRRPLCVPADGNVRMITAFNGTIPGPTIAVCQHDMVVIHLRCRIDPETCSLHSHGMLQKGTNGADGVPWVTQYPIYPGRKFVYRYVAADPGSHYYHSHSGTQRADGAYGHLIVRKPKIQEAYMDYDFDITEHFLSVLEWFPKTVFEYNLVYHRTSVFYDVNLTNILINGHGASSGGRVLPYRITVQQGKSYRIRCLHAGNIVCPMEMSIQGHSMLAFQSDGSDFRRQEFTSISLTNGERYDFILRANQPPGVYSIKFRGSVLCDGFMGVAELVYEGRSGVARHDWNKSRDFGTGRRLNCIMDRNSRCVEIHQLEALQPDIREATSIQFIALNEERTAHFKLRDGARSGELIAPYINNISYVHPEEPFIYQFPTDTCNNLQRVNCRGPYCECTHVIQIRAYSVVDFVIFDMGQLLDVAHPMHIHGHKMSILCVVKIANSVTPQLIQDRYRSGQLYRDCNFHSPLGKDTVAIPDGGYVIARIYFDNPGYWFMHCHVDYHTEEGMAFTLAVY